MFLKIESKISERRNIEAAFFSRKQMFLQVYYFYSFQFVHYGCDSRFRRKHLEIGKDIINHFFSATFYDSWSVIVFEKAMLQQVIFLIVTFHSKFDLYSSTRSVEPHFIDFFKVNTILVFCIYVKFHLTHTNTSTTVASVWTLPTSCFVFSRLLVLYRLNCLPAERIRCHCIPATRWPHPECCCLATTNNKMRSVIAFLICSRFPDRPDSSRVTLFKNERWKSKRTTALRLRRKEIH